MRLPKFRLRTLMILVAIVAILLGTLITLDRRRKRFREIAYSLSGPLGFFSGEDEGRMQAVISWNELMRRKYERAARYPWLPVPPDPPSPK